MKQQKHAPQTLDEIRSAILAILTRQAPNQLKSNELSKALGIAATDPQYDLVRQALESLEESGEIFRGSRRRYGVVVPETVIEGTLKMMRAGQWCIVSDEGPTCEVDIDARHLWTALHGDRVVAKLLGIPEPGELPHGEVTRVVARRTDRLVGTLKRGRGFFIDADDRKIHRTFNVSRNHIGTARVGDKVLAKIHEWIDPYSDPEATVVEVIGRAGEMKAEIKSIALSHNLPFVFPDDVIEEAESHPEEIPEEVIRDRRDIRDMDIFTIDPYDARDFDDAISIEEHADGDVTLGVHIADVSHYVTEGSALDEEAQRRGTSVYLVTGVIPMLPERLSNNLCSLRPNEDRLAYSVFVRLSSRGAIKEYDIVKSVIRSKRRFTYEEALEVLETGRGDYAQELLAINRAAHTQRSLRRRKGSVDFDSTELKFRLDENDFPIEVIQKRATESTKLIEDCMLLANRVVAEHIGNERSSKRGGDLAPFVYRIHDSPPKEKLIDLSNFVKQFGYTMPVENVQPKDIQRLIDAARGTDEEEMINEVALRSMAKAVYSEFNIGHFGLAFKHYTHFTSPIRRYPDLIVHRLLNEYARGMTGNRRQQYASDLGPLTTHCSERERAAVEAERASIKIAEVQFLKQHVGDVFEGIVGGVMPFGLFIELKRYGIEGLAPVRNMNDDYYIYDERTKSLRGRTNRKVYRLGAPVHVRVMRVDEMSSQIDLAIIDEDEFLEEGGEEPMKVIGDDDADHVGADEIRDRRPVEKARRTQREVAPEASRTAREERRGRGGRTTGRGGGASRGGGGAASGRGGGGGAASGRGGGGGRGGAASGRGGSAVRGVRAQRGGGEERGGGAERGGGKERGGGPERGGGAERGGGKERGGRPERGGTAERGGGAKREGTSRRGGTAERGRETDHGGATSETGRRGGTGQRSGAGAARGSGSGSSRTDDIAVWGSARASKRGKSGGGRSGGGKSGNGPSGSKAGGGKSASGQAGAKSTGQRSVVGGSKAGGARKSAPKSGRRRR